MGPALTAAVVGSVAAFAAALGDPLGGGVLGAVAVYVFFFSD